MCQAQTEGRKAGENCASKLPWVNSTFSPIQLMLRTVSWTSHGQPDQKAYDQYGFPHHFPEDPSSSQLYAITQEKDNSKKQTHHLSISHQTMYSRDVPDELGNTTLVQLVFKAAL